MFSFGMLGLISNIADWIQATALMLAIVVAGVVLLLSLIVLFIPFGDRLPVLDRYVRVAPFTGLLAFGVLCSLVTLQLAGDRCDALRAADRQAAAEAADRRDRDIARDLERKYEPTVKRLGKLQSDMEKARNDAKRKALPAPGGACRLGAAAGRLPGS